MTSRHRAFADVSNDQLSFANDRRRDARANTAKVLHVTGYCAGKLPAAQGLDLFGGSRNPQTGSLES